MKWLCLAAVFACTPFFVQAQMNMGGTTKTLKQNALRHDASGTSLEPESSVPPMLMRMSGKWMVMLHGQAEIVEQQQSGPRGHDKLFSVNWVMPMAQRTLAHGQLTFTNMFSLEPATITGRYYPELFQQGETAFDRPIVDGQHPHNFFMALAAIYDHDLGEKGLATLYVAPVGDPALGPIAYPHRASAESNPLAPLGHHLEDSTHIAYDTLTGGITWGPARLEASGFHGREPGENRWIIEAGPVDSWSTRLTVAPAKDWIAQYSIGHLHSPEALHPQEDVLRQTASVAMHRVWEPAALDATAVWGRNHTIGTKVNANGFLFEAEAHLHTSQSIWTRIENLDRTTDLLGVLAPEEESVVGRTQAYTGGYAHRIRSEGWSSLELGAQITAYSTPARLIPYYGDHPVGIAGVLHWRLGK